MASIQSMLIILRKIPRSNVRFYFYNKLIGTKINFLINYTLTFWLNKLILLKKTFQWIKIVIKEVSLLKFANWLCNITRKTFSKLTSISHCLN